MLPVKNVFDNVTAIWHQEANICSSFVHRMYTSFSFLSLLLANDSWLFAFFSPVLSSSFIPEAYLTFHQLASADTVNFFQSEEKE